MTERDLGQLSLVDHLVNEAAPSNAFLERVVVNREIVAAYRQVLDNQSEA